MAITWLIKERDSCTKQWVFEGGKFNDVTKIYHIVPLLPTKIWDSTSNNESIAWSTAKGSDRHRIRQNMTYLVWKKFQRKNKAVLISWNTGYVLEEQSCQIHPDPRWNDRTFEECRPNNNKNNNNDNRMSSDIGSVPDPASTNVL